MKHDCISRHTDKFLILIISTIAVTGNFLWQGHDGFNLWDEGYLWYGARQVLAGEVPILDFMAYDPGRYYWGAAYFWLVGNTGIIDLRISVVAFQLLGIYAGLWTISTALRGASVKKIGYLCIAVTVLMAWMYPRHKVFDISISMIMVAGLCYLLQKPTTSRHFCLGLLVGLAAIFGRNHGVYGAIASLLAMVWITLQATKTEHWWKNGLYWGAGVVSGYLPVVAMCILIPGYFQGVLETILFMFEQGNTNLPLPIPWPWTVGFGTAGIVIEMRWFLIGICFMALAVFGIGTLAWAFRQRFTGTQVHPALVAAACAALPYAHFAFARADVGHLAQGIYPMLVGILIAAATLESWKSKVASSGLTALTSLFILAAWQPGVLARTQGNWAKVEVSGSMLSMEPSTAEAVNLLRSLTDRYASNGRAVLVLPFWPGAYPLLNRHAPLWEIYALSPRSEFFQRAEIERIKKSDPGFALVMNIAMDGREELRFSNSHRLVDEYIRGNFDPVSGSPSPIYEIYKARTGTDGASR